MQGSRRRGPRTSDDYRAFVARRFQLLLFCFLALSSGAVAAVIMATPVYKAELKLMVKHDRTDSVVTPTPNADTSRPVLTDHDVLSQVELIRSDDLLERVADESGLSSRLLAGGRASSDAEALAVATTQLRDEILVTPIKRTWLIDVTYHAPDQYTARHVLDTLARLYLEKHLALHRQSGVYKFFTSQTEQARQELHAAQDRLVTFGRKNGVVSASLERESVLQKVVEFDALRAQAAAAQAETAKRLSAVRKELSSVPARQVAEVRTGDDAGVTRDVRNRILTLEARRSELLRKFTPRYRGVVEIDAQLREARAALETARQSRLTQETVAASPAREWLDTERARVVAEHAAARARTQAFADTANLYRDRAQLLDVRNAEERDLVLQLEGAEQKYLLYAQKAEEARISDGLDRMRIANVVIAQAPTVDYEAKRNPSLAMLPALLLVALCLSFVIAIAVDTLDPRQPSAAVAVVPNMRALQRVDEDVATRIRVHDVQVVEVAATAEIVRQPPELGPRDRVTRMPAPSRPHTARALTLEDLFGLNAPRRLTP